MKQEDIVKLTDEELVATLKNMKSAATLNAVLFGLMIGISIFSTVKNGLGFFTVFPVVLAMFAFNHARKIRSLKKEIESRKLEN